MAGNPGNGGADLDHGKGPRDAHEGGEPEARRDEDQTGDDDNAAAMEEAQEEAAEERKEGGYQ